MTKKLSFAEFRDAINQRSMPTQILWGYVQFEPNSPIPKLSFRSDALTNQPDADYDVDGEIYQLLRQSYNERDVQLKLFSHEGKSHVVAEGDSWFCFPSFAFLRSDIVEWIRFNNRFSITDIAYWGHTLKKILQNKEYLPAGDLQHDRLFHAKCWRQ